MTGRRLEVTLDGQTDAMHDDFSTRVRELAGLADNGDARRVSIAVLGALAGQLSDASARALAADLPEAHAQALTEAGASGGIDEFYAEVAERSGLHEAGGAVGAVLRALAEHADPRAVASARRQLPDELRTLLETDSVARG